MPKETLTTWNGAEHYQKFLESLSKIERVDYDLNSTKISKNIYYDLWKIQEAAWKYMIDNSRSDRHPISEIAQDLIAYYLRAALPEGYKVRLEVRGKYTVENKEKSLFVDIAIYKNNNPHFLIEVKTNLGYQRTSIKKNTDNSIPVEARRSNLSQAFEVCESKIIYVILSDSNVSKEFSSNYWNDKEDRAYPVDLNKIKNSPYNFIFPLFHHCDPFYYSYNEDFDKKTTIKHSTDNEIMSYAEQNIVTPIEHIIQLIQQV